MRDKYEKYGADVFETHQLMEMLLYHSIKRTDTNPTAHNLLADHPNGAFGLSDSSKLCDSEGVGEVSANLLRISSDTVIRLLCDIVSSRPLDTDHLQRTFLWLWYKNKGEKTVAALLLDEKYRYIDCVLLAQGRTVRAEDYAAALIEHMKKNKAKNAVLCHNHANNVERASVEDVMLTGRIKRELAKHRLRLVEHYIVTDSNCVKCSIDGEEKYEAAY